MRARGKEAWLLAALVLLFFHRPLTTATFFFRDLYQLFYPKKLLLTAALRSGELLLWDPFLHAGQPYLASPSNAFFQPANILYLFLPTIWAFNLAIVLHFVLCAVGAWWLARLIGLSPAASLATGAIFAFCGYTLSAANLLLIFSLPAFPFAIAFMHLAMRGNRKALIGAACAIAWPLLSGGAEAAGMLIITVIAWAAATAPRRGLRVGLLSILFGIGLALVQIIPATEVIRNSSRAQRRSFDAFTVWSVDPRRLPELIIPQFSGDTGKLDDRAYWAHNIESEGFPYILSIYFGALSLILATYGAFAARDDMPRRTLFTLALLGILFSLGKWLPLFRFVYDILPFLGTFRFPVKAIAISILPISVLAGCGIDASRDGHPLRGAVMSSGAIFLVLTILFTTTRSFAAAMARIFFREPLAPIIREQLGHSFWHVTIVLVAAAIVVFMRRPALLAALVLIDLVVAGANVNVFAPRTLFDAPAIAPRIRALVADGRFYRAPDTPALQLRAPSDDIMWLARWKIETLSGYTAATFGVPVIFTADYDGLAPKGIAHLTDMVNRAPWPSRLPILRAAGVRAFIAPDAIALPGIVEVARLRTAEAHPLFVYSIADSAAVRFRGHCTAEVRLFRRTFNTSKWSVATPCRGTVVFAESWYPGWKASVDGHERPLAHDGAVFSAITVEPGQHTIEKRYAPRLPLIGAIASLVALAALIAVSRAGSSAPP